MRTTTITVGGLAGASANNICLSQTPGSATNMTINGALAAGGVATLDKPRRVLITSAGNDSGITFTVYGTDWNGLAVSETITGGNAAAVYTNYDFATVTRIATSAAAAGAVTVGTNGIASSRPFRVDTFGWPQIALECNVSGTVNATVQQSLDDPGDATNVTAYTSMTWVSHPDTSLVGFTATVQGNYAYLPVWVRVLLNSGTGTVTTRIVQAGNSAN